MSLRGAVAVIAAVGALGCAGERHPPSAPAPTPPPVTSKTTSPDAGSVVQHPPPVDAGLVETFLPDGGAPTLTIEVTPAAPAVPPTGWTVLETGSGHVNDASVDQGGNLWVAAGPDGLLLQRSGQQGFQRLTMADGLHPYGFPVGGSITVTQLDVLSVAGGEAGNAYVGYNGIGDCEDEWDQHAAAPDPNIYKSGDADHVWLSASGIGVAHYDIYSGPGLVAAEPRGREKLCSIYRIVYDGAHGNVWVGANHGYAYLSPSYTGDPMLLGEDSPASLVEHAHPAIDGYLTDDAPVANDYLLTGGYFGLTVGPAGDLWVGGIYRTFHCQNPGDGGLNFWGCEHEDQAPANQLDLWKDAVSHDARPSQRVDDYVTGLAVMNDGTVWASARNRAIDSTVSQATGAGLAHLDPSGRVYQYIFDGLPSPHLTALAHDPLDDSLWIGSEAGVSRYFPGKGLLVTYGEAAIGASVSGVVSNIQVDTSGPTRRMVVAFQSGQVALYNGQ
jgi:hypothetical protein